MSEVSMTSSRHPFFFTVIIVYLLAMSLSLDLSGLGGRVTLVQKCFRLFTAFGVRKSCGFLRPVRICVPPPTGICGFLPRFAFS